MTTLIIPDVHNKHRVAQRIIDSETSDAVVLLGDYFDDFGDSPDAVQATAEWLKATLLLDGITGVMGNHDLPYRWPGNSALYCSGFSQHKAQAINSVVAKEDWDRLQCFHKVDGWLLTHAGLSSEMPVADKKNADACVDAAARHKQHPWLLVSRFRGGLSNVSGPFWQDWRETMVTQQNQIFGHTPDHQPRTREATISGKLYHAVCIDTHLHHYALLTDGDLSVKQTPVDFFSK